MQKENLIKINDYLWEIPQSFRSDMLVPARFFANEKLMGDILKDRSLEQLINLCTLKGIKRYGLAMPDIHEGYASPIGGVAAIDTEEGIISPGMQGYDINCGMRILCSEYSEAEIKDKISKLAEKIYQEVPSGLGKGRKIKMNMYDLDQILERGAQKLVNDGYGEKEDLENCEAGGSLENADASAVSLLAKKRGQNQVGTLGSGNHFLEIQKVSEIYDEKIAEIFGLFQNQVVIMIHTGSRGLGHQVATDYIKEFMGLMDKYQIKVPDREFACVPFKSPEGQRGFQASQAAANYAWANRQMITYYIRKAWENVLGKKAGSLKALYDVAHNIIKLEKYKINNQLIELAIHRKGATRAFPPHHPDIPAKYQEVGQPVLIPGSMGTASYILHGTEEAEQSFYSACHGAGRTMSRHEAIRKVQGQELKKEMENKGIIVKVGSVFGLAEEAPQAYKNISEVVEVVHQAGLAKKVVQLKPLAVIKG